MSGTSLAPIVLFVFARPAHTMRAIRSLEQNELAERSTLIIYADGARTAADFEQLRETRAVVRQARAFAKVRIVERETNYGLARSIIEGVTDVCAQYGRAIVLEDDLVLSPHFLRYMNEALDCYADDSQVASIHGYCYPTSEPLPETFFLKGADCWGWATWSRAWAHFEVDGGRLLAELRSRGLTREFDFDGAYPYTRMLEDQIAGRNDSWAIRWHASCFLKGLLTLYPGRSLVENTGNDSSGTHCRDTDAFSVSVATSPVRPTRVPTEPSEQARRVFRRFFVRRRSLWSRARDVISRVVK